MFATTLRNNFQALSMPKKTIMIVYFALCMFTTGFAGFTGENILATFSSMTLGNSVEQFSKVFGLMMAMMGMAGFIQTKVKKNNLVHVFIGTELILATFVGYGPTFLYAVFGTYPEHYLMAHYLIIGGTGFLIGFEIPIVMRILAEQGVELKNNLQIVYAMDYFGAFAGSMFFTDYLLQNHPLTQMGFLLSVINLSLAFFAVIYLIRQKMVKNPGVVICLMITVIVSQFYGYYNSVSWTKTLMQKFYDDRIIAMKQTKYQQIVLTENQKLQFNRMYLNGNLQFSSSDEGRYHDYLVHPVMAMNPNAEHILMLGGGDGLGLRELLKYDRIKSVTLVDLDPEMVKFSSTNEIMRKLNKDSFHNAKVFTRDSNAIKGIAVQGVYLETGHVNADKTLETEWVASVDVVHIDADLFIGELHGKKWDTVIIDFPDPSTIELSKLYSREFFVKLGWQLAENAVISIQATSPYHAKEAYLTIQRTMNSGGFKTIPYRENIPSFGEWGYFLAWKDGRTVDDIKRTMKQVQEFEVETDYITPELMLASTAFGRHELKSSETCVNSLMEPCILDIYVKDSWQKY